LPSTPYQRSFPTFRFAIRRSRSIWWLCCGCSEFRLKAALCARVFSTACIWAMWRLGLAVFAGWEKRFDGRTVSFGVRARALVIVATFAGGVDARAGVFWRCGVERAVVFGVTATNAPWGATVLLALCLATHLERAAFRHRATRCLARL
jgi:hypothetical protein